VEHPPIRGHSYEEQEHPEADGVHGFDRIRESLEADAVDSANQRERTEQRVTQWPTFALAKRTERPVKRFICTTDLMHVNQQCKKRERRDFHRHSLITSTNARPKK
jgi:hypothetical protein